MKCSSNSNGAEIAAFAAILNSANVPLPEQERIASFLRSSGIAPLFDFPSPDAVRSALSLSRTTARLLDAMKTVVEAASSEMTSSDLTREQVADDLRMLQHEEMRGMYFDGESRLVHAQTLSIGHESGVDLNAYVCLRPAFLLCAHKIELIHNHPSGDPEPSTQDIASCRVLAKLAEQTGFALDVLWIVTRDSLRKHSLT